MSAFQYRICRAAIYSFAIGLLTVTCLTQSPTVDEPAHLHAGLDYWQNGRATLYAVNPPLSRVVGAVPAYLSGMRSMCLDRSIEPHQRLEFTLGKKFMQRYRDRATLMIELARFALMPIVLLGLWVCMTWAGELGGSRCAIAAGTLWAACPLMIGHGGLITADVAGASIGCLSLYLFRKWLLDRSWFFALLSGLAIGAACSTKFTWIPIFAISLPVLTLISLRREPKLQKTKFCFQSMVGAALVIYVINCVYLFEGTFQPLGEVKFISSGLRNDQELQTQSSSQKANRFSDSIIGQLPLPVPKDYIQGIDVQRMDFEQPLWNRSYLFGRWTEQGHWNYYFVAFLLKEPIGVIGLVFVTATRLAIHFYKNISRSIFKIDNRAVNSHLSNPLQRTSSFDYACLLVPLLVLWILLSYSTGLNIGLRYALPCYPLMFIIISLVFSGHQPFSLTQWLGVACVGLTVLSTLASSPHWIGYFNELVGGPQQGWRYLGDSNVEWGQDLFAVEQWQQSHPTALPFFVIVASGYDPRSLGLEFADAIDVDSLQFQEQQFDQLGLILEPGYYAIGDTVRNGERFNYYASNGHGRMIEQGLPVFQSISAIDRIGSSIGIYKLDKENIAKLQQSISAEKE